MNERWTCLLTAIQKRSKSSPATHLPSPPFSTFQSLHCLLSTTLTSSSIYILGIPPPLCASIYPLNKFFLTFASYTPTFRKSPLFRLFSLYSPHLAATLLLIEALFTYLGSIERISKEHGQLRGYRWEQEWLPRREPLSSRLLHKSSSLLWLSYRYYRWRHFPVNWTTWKRNLGPPPMQDIKNHALFRQYSHFFIHRIQYSSKREILQRTGASRELLTAQRSIRDWQIIDSVLHLGSSFNWKNWPAFSPGVQPNLELCFITLSDILH